VPKHRSREPSVPRRRAARRAFCRETPRWDNNAPAPPPVRRREAVDRPPRRRHRPAARATFDEFPPRQAPPGFNPQQLVKRSWRPPRSATETG